jgi:penicillin-binding protein 1A
MKIVRLLKNLLLTFFSLVLTVIIIGIGILVYLETELPDTNVLPPLQVPLKVYTKDGKLIGEFGAERRNPIPIAQVPQQLINAFLATEDQRFYEHIGVDPLGLLRAAVQLITTGTKSQGGSTITMQVARNYFLSSKKTYARKVEEILLAIKIDSEFSKEKILELYLNKIYFGSRAYGIAAAAQVYYGKPLNQLTLPELAMLAGLPKAPSTINPIANPIGAKIRRDHVLQRMFEHGYIDKQTYDMAVNTPVATIYHGEKIQVSAPYVAQMVTDAMLAHYGEEAATASLKIYTTIDSKTQIAANNALRDTLLQYDQRHGYRGPKQNLGHNLHHVNDWLQTIAKIPTVNGLQAAVVTKIMKLSAQATFANGENILIPWQGLRWARHEISDKFVGSTPKEASDILKVGDVIRIMKLADGSWSLAQIPQVEGALVALSPQNGAILALVGGFDYTRSNYNRVTQAERQPGSSFKPFVYAAALDRGFTLATTINDAPFVMYDASLGGLWRPQNDDHKFNGPTRLRIALSKSMNLVAIRLLQSIGINYTVHYASRFGFDPKQLPHSLSLALGTALVSPLQMATGYAVFANGGYHVDPYLIDHIVNGTTSKIVYQAHPKIACLSCIELTNALAGNSSLIAPPEQQAARVVSPQTAYLMTSALQDVILHGTGSSAISLNRPDLAGKTGTSNSLMDAWFSGFNGDIVATAWVGYDYPRSLDEFASKAALPMWINFMQSFLQGKPENTMSQPPNIVTARIDPRTGLLASDGEPGIFEIFRRDNVPREVAPPTMSTGAISADASSSTKEAGQGDQPLF